MGTKSSLVAYWTRIVLSATVAAKRSIPEFTRSFRKNSRNFSEYMFAVRGTAMETVVNTTATSWLPARLKALMRFRASFGSKAVSREKGTPVRRASVRTAAAVTPRIAAITRTPRASVGALPFMFPSWKAVTLTDPGPVRKRAAQRNRSSEKGVRSKREAPLVTRSATISPITGENLKPWPEHGLTMKTCSCSG